MHRLLLAAFTGLCLAWAGTAHADVDPASKSKSGCAKHGTAIDFYSTPVVAAKAARMEEKLVFVLHVSGLFEDPKLT